MSTELSLAEGQPLAAPGLAAIIQRLPLFGEPAPRYTPGKPLRDRKYLGWVGRQPCAACGRQRGVDAAHTGPRGLRQKAGDDTAIPLCHRRCHAAYDADPHGFAEAHQMDVPAIIAALRTAYPGGAR